jgi:hypothetical protein
MHNLALALHRRGAQVSGSDDEIFEPAQSSRLAAAGLLPAQEGWDAARITAGPRRPLSWACTPGPTTPSCCGPRSWG